MTSHTHTATGCKLLFLIHCLEKMSQLHTEEEGWRITTVIHLYYLPVETSYLVTIPLSLCFLQQLHKLHNLIPMRALHLSCYRTVISLVILKQNPLQCYCSMFYYTLHSTEMSVNKSTKAYANQSTSVNLCALQIISCFILQRVISLRSDTGCALLLSLIPGSSTGQAICQYFLCCFPNIFLSNNSMQFNVIIVWMYLSLHKY